MNQSLNEFKRKFFEDLLEIHWRHWTALGVASHVQPERHWTIDLEALIVSTLAIGLHDKRLLSASLEWLTKNGKWVNLAHLKRIAKVFREPFVERRTPVLSPRVTELLSETLKEFNENTVSFEKSGLPEAEESIIKGYREFFKSFRAREIVTEVKVRQPVLVQLLLRSIFGVGARADVLVYLFFNNSGSSNSIAKEVFYDQKNVYRILERWAGAGVVTKIAGKKIANYSLSNREQWFRLLQLKESLTYLNWAKTFFMCDRLVNALVTPPWSDDEYLLSSFFRDLLSDVKPIAKSLNIQIPEPSAYPGPEYFAPFASAMLHILKKLRSHHVWR